MDPESRIVLWHSGGKPQPTNRAVLEGVMATGRTHAAVGRPRTHLLDPDQMDPTHVISTESTWPPRHLMVPDAIIRYRRTPDLDRQQCYICMGYGHSGIRCPFLTAVYMCTDVGIQCLREAEVEIPRAIQEGAGPFVVCLRLVLSYRYPLRMACIVARRLMQDELLEEELEIYGDYVDKERMAKELNYPRDWEWTSWDKLFTQLVSHRASMGLRPPTPRKDTRKDLVPGVLQTQSLKSDSMYRNPKASATVSRTGAGSTHDHDFTDLPIQQDVADTQQSTQQSDTQQDSQQSDTQQEIHEEAQQSIQQESHVEDTQQEDTTRPTQQTTQQEDTTRRNILYFDNVD